MPREPHIIRAETDRDKVVALVRSLDLGKPWAITVEPFKKRRTQSQLALMWVWVDQAVKLIHDDTGQDKDDLHEYFKRKFLTPRRFQVMGEVVEVYTTKELTTAQMTEYMEKIRAFASIELGILLPSPEELHR